MIHYVGENYVLSNSQPYLNSKCFTNIVHLSATVHFNPDKISFYNYCSAVYNVLQGIQL